MKYFFLALLFFIFSSNTFGQFAKPGKKSHTEIGFFRGYATYYGDLADKGAYINMKDKGAAFGFYLRKNFNEYTALRLGFTTGLLQGSDADAKDAYERNRNLSFLNTISEYSILTEINLLPFDICRTSAAYAPYLFFGFSIYTHEPKALLNGEQVSLLPLRTEGQNTFPYSGPAGARWDDGGTGGYRGEYYLTQIALPIGLGIKYRFYRNSTIAFELGFRKTWFDYLDDVSKSYVANPIGAGGDPTSARLADRYYELENGVPHEEGDLRGTKKGNDFYTFLGITFTFSTAKCGKRNPIKCFSFNKWS